MPPVHPTKKAIFVGQVSKEDYAYLQERMYKYKGFFIQKRFLRQYPENTSANVLGYISEVNEGLLKTNTDYQLGELVGYQGVEKQYEKYLEAKNGSSIPADKLLSTATEKAENGG